MFGRGSIITVLKDAVHHPVYRALVIDVGAFTTDFAMLTLKPDDHNTSNPDSNISLAQKSIPVGISDLDASMIDTLPKEKSEWLRKANPLEWEDFRPAVYSDGKGVRVPDLGIIGGPADADTVRNCIVELTKKMNEETAAFLESMGAAPSGSLEELV